MNRLLRAGLVALALMGGAQRVSSTIIGVQDVTGSPGDTPDVCVVMSGSGNQVAGVQMDLVWDTSCLSITMGDATSGACVKNASINKETFRTRVQPSGNSLRVLFLSITDLSPMPDGQLFCCQFQIDASAAGRRCPITLNNAHASDPKGNADKGLTVRPGTVVVSDTGGGAAGGGGRPAAPPPPMAPPVVSAPGMAPAGKPAAGAGAAPFAPPPAVPQAQAPEAPEGAALGQPTAPATPAASTPAARGTASPRRTPAAVGTSTPAHTPRVEGTKTPAAAGGTPGQTPKAKQTPKATPAAH